MNIRSNFDKFGKETLPNESLSNIKAGTGGGPDEGGNDPIEPPPTAVTTTQMHLPFGDLLIPPPVEPGD